VALTNSQTMAKDDTDLN